MFNQKTETQTLQSGDLEAVFDPKRGMNLLSLRRGVIEAIDQSTISLFEERYAGLGALIGPHFHHRKQIPDVPHPERFPHIERLKQKGAKEFFSHGIGRYAPWTVTKQTKDSLHAILRGEDEWNGVLLKELEGQDFTMRLHADLKVDGLTLRLSVVSESASVVGFHTYYGLSGREGQLLTRVQPSFCDQGTWKPIPQEWGFDEDHNLKTHIQDPWDYGFRPFPDPLSSHIQLITPSHILHIDSHCSNEEHSFQIWHPENASFVCIEPLSAKDPRNPILTVSEVQVRINPTPHP